MEMQAESKIVRISARTNGKTSVSGDMFDIMDTEKIGYGEMFAPYHMIDKLCSIGGMVFSAYSHDGEDTRIQFKTNLKVEVLTIEELAKESRSIEDCDVPLPVKDFIENLSKFTQEEKSAIEELTELIPNIVCKQVEIETLSTEEFKVGEYTVPVGTPIKVVAPRYFLSR